MQKRKENEWIMLKVDFENAYDLVEWKCFNFKMAKIHFSIKWRKWIME